MFIKKIVLGIFMSLYCSIFLFSEELTHGILFRSSAEPVSNRTSLSLFDKKLQKFEDEFSISFELSIWDIKQFGYILRIINEENQEVDFVFVNFRGEDDLYLDFHSPITHNSVSIPIDKDDLYERRWLPVKITFDLKLDQAVVLFKERLYTCKSIGFKNPSKLKFVYGLHGLNLDVPQMVVRDIHIEKKKNPAFRFPLDESKGNEIYDISGKRYGNAKNPEWIIDRHHFWQKETVFHPENVGGITYDSGKNRIIIFTTDSALIYFPQYKQRKGFRIKDLPLKPGSAEAIYCPAENKSYLYTLGDTLSGHPTLAIVDMLDYSVELKYPVMDSELSHHNVFSGKEGRSPYIFGGYGKYTYSNKFFTYNPDLDVWEEVDFTGDSILPRFFSAFGEGFTSSQKLIMGGFGNESGKYEYGGRHLYDLLCVDLDTKVVKKMWEIEEVASGVVPCSNLILNKAKTHLYTLCYAHHRPESALRLYRFSVSDGSYDVVSDSIPLDTENPKTTVYLFFNELMQEFYSVVKEFDNENNSSIFIYSLLAPPVSESELKSEEKVFFLWVLWVSVIVGLLFVIYILRKKQNIKQRKLKESVLSKEYFPEPVVKKMNALYVLGDFTVYDKKGTDISYRFSSKLKSLFALILLNSKADTGISTEMMTSELWPDKDSASAKNTRGVTINRLRSILADMEGITLIHQNSKWFFSFENAFYCDYIECEKIMDRLDREEKSKDEYMHELLHILKRGALFPNLQESWIDAFKRNFENNAEKILRESILELYENKKYAQLIQYSELYFIIDPLNEEIMNLCLKAFQKIGKSDQALVLYNKFVSNYRDSMGEDPKQSFPV